MQTRRTSANQKNQQITSTSIISGGKKNLLPLWIRVEKNQTLYISHYPFLTLQKFAIVLWDPVLRELGNTPKGARIIHPFFHCLALREAGGTKLVIINQWQCSNQKNVLKAILMALPTFSGNVCLDIPIIWATKLISISNSEFR